MKKVLLKLMTITGFCFAFVAHGQQACGHVSTNVITLKQDEFPVIITNGGKNASAMYRGVAVAPGKHVFDVVVVSKNKNVSYRQNGMTFQTYDQLSDNLEIELDVEANRVYRLVAKVVDPAVLPRYRRYEVVVAYQSDKPCEAKEVLAKLTNAAPKTAINLPQQLEYRLNMVMKDLRNFYHSEGIKQQIVDFGRQPQLIDVLGIVLDQQFAHSKGLKVLAVTPSSAAANIGLQPNDIIVKINQLDLIETKHNTSRQELANALKLAVSKVTKDKQAVITVNRNHQLVELVIRYMDITLPGYRLQLEL